MQVYWELAEFHQQIASRCGAVHDGVLQQMFIEHRKDPVAAISRMQLTVAVQLLSSMPDHGMLASWDRVLDAGDVAFLMAETGLPDSSARVLLRAANNVVEAAAAMAEAAIALEFRAQLVPLIKKLPARTEHPRSDGRS